ncbi:MAG: flagellar biosynthetic protein FliO [Clostridia bacterium]|nr:flagellar biosynthetic protein FliO [Clostridia bacterium]MBR3810072.1 flagellar biosynthetic protein FliO [Clostridia bacterium]
MGQTVESILVGIGTIVLMLAVFVGAYYFSKFFAKQYQPKMGGKFKNIEIIERMAVGKDQSLALVRVSDKVFLLAFTAQSVTKIEEMDASLFPENTVVQNAGENNFMTFFTDAYNNLLNKKNEGKGDGKDE